jgi:hypothetical protein
MNQAAINSKHRSTEEDVKTLTRILYTVEKLLSLFTHKTAPYMPAHYNTAAEYALQWIVVSFGTLLFELAVCC